MTTTEATETLTYEVFVNDPPPQDIGVLPNGEPKRFSPEASTLIYGRRDAVLTDPGLTATQARVLGDWVAGKGRNVTDIFITHGHGDHWFAAGLLAERFGARVVASAAVIAQMHASVATRPLLWDKVRRGLSAGRVQTVALRVIVEREREIRAFQKREYWTVDVDLLAKKNPVLSTRLIKAGDETPELVNQYFNDSTGEGDFGDQDMRGPWNNGDGWEFVEAPAFQELKSSNSGTRRPLDSEREQKLSTSRRRSG